MLVIVVPFCNVRDYLEQCVASIASQSVTQWRCYLIDDKSTDGSLDIARSIVSKDKRFVLIKNELKRYQLGSFHATLWRSEIADSDICVTIDGDDWLPDTKVFQRVLRAYEDGRTWITWGSFAVSSNGKLSLGRSRATGDLTGIRRQPWVTSHLRTFKVFLFRSIKKADLLNPQGAFWTCTGDMAIMFPMLEMAGKHRAKYLPDVNYIYNGSNPLSVERIRPREQQEAERSLRAMPPYSVLSPRIPKIIHQLWIGPHRRPDLAMQTWRQQNPDWEYRLWSEEALATFDFRNANQIEHTKELNGKCDLMRYEILERCGGVFIDADAVALLPLDPFFQFNDSFSCYENEAAMPGLVACGYMGATTGNSLMKHLVDEAAKIPIDHLQKRPAWKTIGPQFFTHVIQSKKYSDIRVYPSWYFIPVHRTGRKYSGPGPVYAHQLWGSTFNLYGKGHSALYGKEARPDGTLQNAAAIEG